MSKYKILAFDFDGTLFDTEALNFRAYQLAYFDLGVEITEEMFAKTLGHSVYQFNDDMGVNCDVEKLRELKQHYYKDMVLLAKPNTYLLNILKETKLKTALVTTARFTNIQPLLEKYELEFDWLITQEIVDNYKPHPECYETLKSFSKTHAHEILAFEDSRAGFVSARQAGLDCVKIGEFCDDCIKDMSGGSESRTVLLFENDELIVRKIAYSTQAAIRLKNQYEWMMENRQPNFIEPINCKTVTLRNETRFSYDMNYEFAPSLYEYINKIKVLPEVCKMLKGLGTEPASETNDEDVRREMYLRYIEEISDMLGKPAPISLSQIPEFVNWFRLTPYHGDSTFENILIQRDGTPLFIDPVPDNNTVNGIAHDFSKLGQSLMGYEAIRDGKVFNYDIELSVFDSLAQKHLTKNEYRSLKFFTACLYLRRLKHQVKQNPALVEPYYSIACKLLKEFVKGDYQWHK